MKPQPRPVTGAIFGFFLGVVTVALLWQLGIFPPDRLVVFGLVAIITLISTFALTQRVSLVRKRFVVVVVFAALLGGVALTGIPEFVGGGSLSEGCTIEAKSSLTGSTGPAQTSAMSPFRAAVTDNVSWVASTDTSLTTGSNAGGMSIAGFQILLKTGTLQNPTGAQELAGVSDVQNLQNQLKDASGLVLTGTYQVFGYVHAAEGSCDTVAYVDVPPASVFATPVLIGLWVLAGMLFIVILTLGIGVRRSIRTSARLEATTPAAVDGAEESTTTNEPPGQQAAARPDAIPESAGSDDPRVRDERAVAPSASARRAEAPQAAGDNDETASRDVAGAADADPFMGEKPDYQI